MLKFNPDNLTHKRSAEFQLLKRKAFEISMLRDLLAKLEKEESQLHNDIENGLEPNSFVKQDYIRLLEMYSED